MAKPYCWDRMRFALLESPAEYAANLKRKREAEAAKAAARAKAARRRAKRKALIPGALDNATDNAIPDATSSGDQTSPTDQDTPSTTPRISQIETETRSDTTDSDLTIEIRIFDPKRDAARYETLAVPRTETPVDPPTRAWTWCNRRKTILRGDSPSARVDETTQTDRPTIEMFTSSSPSLEEHNEELIIIDEIIRSRSVPKRGRGKNTRATIETARRGRAKGSGVGRKKMRKSKAAKTARVKKAPARRSPRRRSSKPSTATASRPTRMSADPFPGAEMAYCETSETNELNNLNPFPKLTVSSRKKPSSAKRLKLIQSRSNGADTVIKLPSKKRKWTKKTGEPRRRSARLHMQSQSTTSADEDNDDVQIVCEYVYLD